MRRTSGSGEPSVPTEVGPGGFAPPTLPSSAGGCSFSSLSHLSSPPCGGSALPDSVLPCGGKVGGSSRVRPIVFDMNPIGRKHLPHEGLPLNPTSAEGEIYFVTICCIPRNTNQLATPEIWRAIEETLAFRETHGDLICRLALAMPDHLHGLFGFPGSKPMTKVVADMKSWLAKQHGIQWQRDFFDHRLRNPESAAEKAKYIRMNPVRAGLVANPQDWPYQKVGRIRPGPPILPSAAGG